jgi:hypothetical protein
MGGPHLWHCGGGFSWSLQAQLSCSVLERRDQAADRRRSGRSRPADLTSAVGILRRGRCRLVSEVTFEPSLRKKHEDGSCEDRPTADSELIASQEPDAGKDHQYTHDAENLRGEVPVTQGNRVSTRPLGKPAWWLAPTGHTDADNEEQDTQCSRPQCPPGEPEFKQTESQ